MTPEFNEHDKVVENIRDANTGSFNVLTNLVGEQHYIGSIFPDLILKDKTNDIPVFIIEVKKNGNIATSMQQWKSAPSIPATLYFVVPESDLASAKSIAQVIGLQSRFGSYKILDNGSISVDYE
jgi:hypothetical protein